MKIEGGVILVASGRYVAPLDLKPEDVAIEDIAHALSNQCRYSGHTREFYSVAEHCVRVSWLLEDQGYDAETQLWGLLHDASEAYLVDLPRPLKDQAEFGRLYREAEDRAMAVICDHFGLEEEMPEAVRAADVTLMATERRDLMPANGDWVILDGVEPEALTISPWRPATAQHRFLARFWYCSP